MDIDKVLRTEIHLKIVNFFHENQSSIDTPRGVATWVGGERAKVKNALEDLVKAEILVAHRATSTTGYGYTSDEKMVSKIEKFLKNKKTP
jgi:NADPH-dependent ferric siderophore reductase